jgi:hypothetical protein
MNLARLAAFVTSCALASPAVPPTPRPEPIEITELPLPPTAPSDHPGACTPALQSEAHWLHRIRSAQHAIGQFSPGRASRDRAGALHRCTGGSRSSEFLPRGANHPAEDRWQDVSERRSVEVRHLRRASSYQVAIKRVGIPAALSGIRQIESKPASGPSVCTACSAHRVSEEVRVAVPSMLSGRDCGRRIPASCLYSAIPTRLIATWYQIGHRSAPSMRMLA